MSNMYWYIGPDYKMLEPYGLSVLTGESCCFSMRMLVDVNEKGRQLLIDFLGLPYDVKLADNWNTTVEKPGDSIGSIMLSRDMLFELFIFIALYIEKCTCISVFPSQGQVKGIWTTNPDELKTYRADVGNYGVDDAYTKTNGWDQVWVGNDTTLATSRGGRNTHQASGRIT